jgi:tRNA uridine 5-carbamoylmethylation protein Kti12
MLHVTPRYDPFSEGLVTGIQYALIGILVNHRCRVIVDDTNLNPHYLAALKNHVERLGARFEVKDFTGVPVELCIERDQARPDETRVGEDIIRGMHERWLAPLEGQAEKVNT